MTLRKFQRIFINNGQYRSFDKIPFMESLAYVTQEFLYSEKVEDEWCVFRMDERIKLYDFMTLLVYVIGASVDDFGKATIKGYIEDLKIKKNNYQSEDSIEYLDDSYMLVTNASFELIDALLWMSYVYSKVRSDFNKDGSWIRASETLFNLAWKESGYTREAFNDLPHIKCTNQAVDILKKHIGLNVSKQARQSKETETIREPKVDMGNKEEEKKMRLNNKIFIVHGHNEAVKEKVARILEKLHLEPIILHEQPDGGKTLIEKFEANSADVNFAVILLTGDDEGKAVKSETFNRRARQNVIFEMGFFMGILSRSHVFMLLEDGVEKPSDIDGIVYTSLKENWQHKLVKELKACGYKVDANDLI